MSEEITEQKKGLAHIRHIFWEAMKIWEKEFEWVHSDMDACLLLAMERHRESLTKPKEVVKKCLGCGSDISIRGLYDCNDAKYCIICWRKTFLNNGHACL